MSTWLDRVAADLLHIEHDLRATLRSITTGGRPARMTGRGRLEISTDEARTLLRGAIPAPIAVTRLRQPHARLVAALSIFRDHLIRLNDPMALSIDPEFVLLAAVDLIDELRTWHRIVRWRVACRRAKVKIPLPEDFAPVAIRAIMRLDTRHARERDRNTPHHALPSAPAGELDMIQSGAWHPPSTGRVPISYGTQGTLALEMPLPTAEIVDFRQRELFEREKPYAHAA